MPSAPLVLDTFIVLGIALLLGQWTGWIPSYGLVAAIGLGLLAWRRLSTAQRLLAIGCLALGAYRCQAELAHFEHARAVALSSLGAQARCTGTVRIDSSPFARGEKLSFSAQVIELSCDRGQSLAAGTKVRLYGPLDDIRRKDVCEIVAGLGPVEIFRNAETPLVYPSAARSGVLLSGGLVDLQVKERPGFSLSSWIDAARNHARRRIEASYPKAASPMARALVLGENDLDPQDDEAFRLSGLSHLLAVSGTHIAIAVLGLVSLLRRALVRVEALSARWEVGRIAAFLGLALTWGYAEFAGGGGSVRRAAWMTTAALLARALGREPQGVRAFGLSLVAGALVDPLASFDVSLGLSAAATAGLLVLSKPLEKGFEKWLPRAKWLAGPLSSTLSATSFCTPWLIALSPTLSLVGILANVFAVPIGELVSLPACLAHLLLFPVPALERGVALLGSGSLLVVRAIARLGASWTWLSLPVPSPTGWQLVVLGWLGAALLLRSIRPKNALLLGASALGILELGALHLGAPKDLLRITFFDVGQGDSILVDFPSGKAMLIDGGGAVGNPVDPGVRVLAPALRTRRRSRLDYAVLSHPHPDHFTGLASSLSTIKVGEFWDNGQGQSQGAGPLYASLLERMRKRGVPVLGPKELCARPLHEGRAVVQVLGPCPDIEPDAHANNNSFVLRISLGQRAALLVGDTEREEEQRLLAQWGPAALQADVLKVGHHGSRTSSSGAFLDAVRPQDAVISCGVRNRFGHPAPSTLLALSQRAIRLWRIDQQGAVRWETDGEAARLSSVMGPRAGASFWGRWGAKDNFFGR